MLKISLILTILACLGAAAVSHLIVAPKIAEIETARDSAERDATSARSAQRKAEQLAKESGARAQELEQNLTDVQTAFESARAKAIEQQARAEDLDTKLQIATRDLNEANQELNRYLLTGKTAPEILELNDQIRDLTSERNAYVEENRILSRTLNQVQSRLDYILGEGDVKVEMPDLKGRVVAVDPKWDFVVLDVGEQDGAVEYGEMMVSRNGKLVGKVQITSVQPNRSIANVLSEWKQDAIMAGDSVVY